MGCRRTLALLLGVLLAGVTIGVAAQEARAESLSTFSEAIATRRATHVVVVTEGDTIDGRVKVLESWRGDLAAGDEVELEGLAAFEKGPNAVRYGPVDDDTLTPKAIGKATFARAILYLVRTAKGFSPAFLDIEGSIVCVEKDGLYAIEQLMNPGPQRLLPLTAPIEMAPRMRPKGEDELRTAVRHYDDLARALADILTDDRARNRAAALEPLCTDLAIGQAATSALLGCGTEALRVLWRLYRSGTWPMFRPQWMRGIVEIGGIGEAPSIATLLRDETAYWRETAPTLRQSSWTAPMLRRYWMLGHLLDALAALGAPVGEDDAKTLLSLADASDPFAHANYGSASPLRDSIRAYLRAIHPPPPHAK